MRGAGSADRERDKLPERRPGRGDRHSDRRDEQQQSEGVVAPAGAGQFDDTNGQRGPREDAHAGRGDDVAPEEPEDRRQQLQREDIERGIAPPSYAILETTGRRSGEPRRTPVGNGLDGETFWIVAEHGRRAAYVRNVEADPRVHVKVGGRWRKGVARLMPDDDPRERQRKIGLRFNAAVVRAMGTQLLTVRVDLAAPGAATHDDGPDDRSVGQVVRDLRPRA